MVEGILVEAYGSKLPINQVGNISVPESRMITIQVWDTTMVPNVEKAILDSELGINPQTDGSLIRLPIPNLSEERRVELTKLASKYAEENKISIRNVRREFIEKLKSDQKENSISEDELKKFIDDVQIKTDKFIGEIDKL